MEAAKRYVEALAIWQEAARMTEEPHIHARLGRAFLLAGRAEEGEDLLRRLILATPNHAHAYFFLGFHLHGANRLDDAKPLLERGVGLEPVPPPGPPKDLEGLFR